MSRISVVCLFLCLVGYCAAFGGQTQMRPNVLIMFADDLGYGDLPPYDVEGVLDYETPYLTEMMQDGMRFTQWYTQPTCTPSRTALQTGRLPIRAGMVGDTVSVLKDPTVPTGLAMSEVTIAEKMKEEGYATYYIGKWHLGMNEFTHNDTAFFPTRQGYDYYLGHPYTHNHGCTNSYGSMVGCILYENEEIIQQPIRLWESTDRFTDKTLELLERHAEMDQPFYMYLSYLQVHGAMYANSRYEGTHEELDRPAFTDMMAEMDWSVGKIYHTLKELGLWENTIVIFTSDNGPYLEDDIEGGNNGILRGGKFQSMEGGIRVPASVTWPDMVQPGSVSDAMVNSMDIFPTLCSVLDMDCDALHFDGKDMSDALFYGGDSAWDRMPYFISDRIWALRIGDLKAHFATPRWYPGYETCEPPAADGTFRSGCSFIMEEHDIQDPPLIFNVVEDPSEEDPINGFVNETSGIGFTSSSEVMNGAMTQQDLDMVISEFIAYRDQLLAEFPDGSYEKRLDATPSLTVVPCCGDGYLDAYGNFYGTGCGCPQAPVPYNAATGEGLVYVFQASDHEDDYEFQHDLEV